MTNMTLVHKIFLSSTIVALTLGNVSVQAGKIKCWKNSDGIRECGFSVPPEYAQKGHDVINNQGIKVKHNERALNKEELAARKLLKEEEKAKETARVAKERDDMVLLNTFANEDEIVMARNGKITSIRTEIRLTYKSLNKAKDRQTAARKQAASLERAGKKVPKAVTDNIQQTEKQIKNYEQFISAKKTELDRINSQFENDMVRYKELRRPRQVSTNPK